MGLRIGQTPSTLASLRSAPELGQVRLDGRGSALAQGVNGVQDPRGPFFRQEEPAPRVGFGEGTLSPQAAALRTINRTVEESRRIQPSLEEIRAQFQLRAAERRREAAEEVQSSGEEGQTRAANEDSDVDPVERLIPAPSARARNFVNPLNEPASVSQVQSVEPRVERAAANDEPPPERPDPPIGQRPPSFDVRI